MTVERVWSVQWVRFVCPGCDEEVHLTNCGTNQVLICARCQVWGVAGHLAMKRLRLEIDPPLSLRLAPPADRPVTADRTGLPRP